MDSLQLDVERHKAWKENLQPVITTANERELLMALDLVDMSDDEEDIIDEGVTFFKKCIQTNKIKEDYLLKIFDKLAEDLNLKNEKPTEEKKSDTPEETPSFTNAELSN